MLNIYKEERAKLSGTKKSRNDKKAVKAAFVKMIGCCHCGPSCTPWNSVEDFEMAHLPNAKKTDNPSNKESGLAFVEECENCVILCNSCHNRADRYDDFPWTKVLSGKTYAFYKAALVDMKKHFLNKKKGK